MALRNMPYFMRHHGCQFRFILRSEHERGMHGDETARQCKRIQHGIAHRKKEKVVPRLAPRLGPRRQQRIAEIVQVFEQRRVIQIVAIASDIAHDLLAKLAFHQRREFLTFGVTQTRQALRGSPRWRDRSR